jgi:D-xylose transport system substrate-binding protein
MCKTFDNFRGEKMTSKRKTFIANIIAIFIISSMLFGCAGGNTAAPAADVPATDAIKIGLSFSDFATERWKPESELLTKLLEEKGYEVLVQEANHDVKLQNDQIDNMVSQGVKGLIVIAEDGAAAATAVDKAAAAGVKVIAYDRLIKTKSIAAYLSFDNVEVGRQEALGVMTALGLPGSTKWTADNPAKVVMSGGSPTDNNAVLVRQGQMEVVQPYLDSGVITIVADQWVTNWDAAEALKMMENILTAQNNEIDAVVASNDGTALGELQALKAQGLAGIVPISGQDATADGCNSIVKGEQTVTVYKDIRLLAPKAVDMMDALIKGEAIQGVQSYSLKVLTGEDLEGDVSCVFLPVVQVTKDNVYEEIVVSEFQPYDAVYRDIPADQLPPKPGEEAAAPAEPAEAIKIGLSFSDFATERWKPESELLTQLLEAKGYEVLVQEANHDVKLQNDQIDNMVAQGVKGLIVIAEDGAAAATAVDKAAAAGVQVIAYDRLIKTKNIAAYLSFDNVEVGRQEALGVMTALGLPDSTEWTAANPAKVVMSGGSPTDNNAVLVRQGQMEIVQPYIDSGVVKIVADQWVTNWDAAEALKMMENILTAQNNDIDAVVASNDGTALGELQALKAQGLAGIVPISGQDATADGCNSIVKGEQTVTVYKDIRLLAPKAVDMMDALLKGEAIQGVAPYSLKVLTGEELEGDVQCVFLAVVQVTKDNVYDEIVVSGFQPYDAVYRDIPADQLPAKP